MQGHRLLAILIMLAIGMAASGGGPIGRSAEAQTLPGQSQEASGKDTPTNDLQRSVQIYGYKMAGNSGAARGEVIYFFKCWVCHNSYTEGGPKLKDLYQHTQLFSGDPVNDDTVTKQIKDGSPRMPSFRTTLADSDMADLLSYLRGGKCCFEGIDPPLNPWYREPAQKAAPVLPSRNNLSGGPRGVVRSKSGEPLEGIMVQLIAPNAVRTTVYSNDEGRYEFPKLQTGLYTLRIAKPLEVMPYQRDSVRIDGAAKLEDIVLERRSETEYLPPAPDVLAQLSGEEWLWNLSGTGEEKRTFSNTCGEGCHSFQQVFRNRYDERSWRLIVERMTHYAGSPIIVRNPGPGHPEQEEMIVKWLARIRGPDSKISRLKVLPGPRGAATRVVVTEYELPRVMISPHDVSGDSKGDIWYTSHRTPNMGKVDPRTGIAKEYPVPITPGALPGTHRVQVDKRDILWLTENWAHNLVRFDPSTGKFRKMPLASQSALNAPMGGNMAVAPDGYVWKSRDGAVDKLDPETGKSVQKFPLTKVTNTYDDIVSDDGKFWAGGSPAGDGKTLEMLNIQTGEMLEVETFSRHSTGARGGFDPQNNAWFGGRGGALLELDAKTRRAREYWPPIPYSVFYEAMPDKNGEVWAGEWQGGGFLRLNPRTERWIEYVMPEPYAQDRRTWIDNSTNPVTVWYVDNNGYLVRIQPLE